MPGESPYPIPSALSQPSLSPLVVSVSDQAGTRPGWIPLGPRSGWEPWADHFIKGIRGLIDFYSRSRTGTGGGGEDHCYERWESEYGRCSQFRPFGSRYQQACQTRARDRYNLCVTAASQIRRSRTNSIGTIFLGTRQPDERQLTLGDPWSMLFE
jgi:hypothetical protein